MKYRIWQLASGRWRLEINAAGQGLSEHWVNASTGDFATPDAAHAGMMILIADQKAYYDDRGKPC